MYQDTHNLMKDLYSRYPRLNKISFLKSGEIEINWTDGLKGTSNYSFSNTDEMLEFFEDRSSRD